MSDKLSRLFQISVGFVVNWVWMFVVKLTDSFCFLSGPLGKTIFYFQTVKIAGSKTLPE
ncbi:MAG: hypothetical protein LBQ66_15620 [Planctomycetaceae bacterium]|jgi:hypothetical protein|nr:hypothetical protein [Planctomycetaceae bacterium]